MTVDQADALWHNRRRMPENPQLSVGSGPGYRQTCGAGVADMVRLKDLQARFVADTLEQHAHSCGFEPAQRSITFRWMDSHRMSTSAVFVENNTMRS